MKTRRDIPHTFNGEDLAHVLVSDGSGTARPAVVIVPTVMGVSDLEMDFADKLVALGYSVLVADLFGTKFRGAERDTMFGEMKRLLNDRANLRDRLVEVLEIAKDADEVDASKVAVIGPSAGHGKSSLDRYSGSRRCVRWPTSSVSMPNCSSSLSTKSSLVRSASVLASAARSAAPRSPNRVASSSRRSRPDEMA